MKCLRRSSVSLAFGNQVPLTDLQTHGGWKSDAIFTYLGHTPKAFSQVALTFQKLIN